jgi:nucleotidyltransferase AbiEii toxin of type IV toxin-antitoxin system
VTDEAFVLYGGTAIALYLGHRESVDFDFFTDQTFQPEELLAKFHFLRAAEFLQTQRDNLTALTADGSGSHRVKISFFGGLEFGRLKDPVRTADGVLEVASLQDLLAHKLKVLLQRVETRDYLDIDALLQHGLDLAQGCAGARALFTVFAPQECLKALTYFNDPSLETLPEPLKQRLVKATAGVKSIPDVKVSSKTLSKR